MGKEEAKQRSSIDSWGKILRWSLLSVNLAVLIGCLVVFAVGIWTVVEKSFMRVLLNNNLYTSSAYIMVVAGIIVTTVACLGIYGAWKESKCALLSYFAFLFLFFIILLVGGILSIVFKKQISNGLKTELIATIRDYDPAQPNLPVTYAWDNTQTRLNCCGIAFETNPLPWNAWKTNTKVNSGSADNKVPWSCCSHDIYGKATDCNFKNPVVPDEIFRTDCLTAGSIFISDHATLLAALSVVVATIMIFAMILSITLYIFI